ncbi:E3 ubiquitin-protein ligase TRIM31 [Lemmus lemmus]
MANLNQTSKLLEDMTCPICMEILQDPVTIDCGHNFCLQCINQVGKTTENLQCPLCRLPVNKNTFRPNKLLASIAEKIQAMDPAEFQPEEKEPRCQKHKEKLHYFCEEDGEFLCLLCSDSRDLKNREVTLIDEAAQNYKVQIETEVQDLGQKDKEIIKEKTEGEGAIQVFRAQVHLEKLKILEILEEFKHVRQRLEEEERFLLSRLRWLEQEGVKQIEESKEFKFYNPTPVPMNLEKKMSDAKARHESIIESQKKLTVPVILDSASADPNRTFSQDLKKASLYLIDSTSNTQAKPRQFDPFHCVRGYPGLSSGCGVWEVKIQAPPDRVGIVGVVAALPQRSAPLSPLTWDSLACKSPSGGAGEVGAMVPLYNDNQEEDICPICLDPVKEAVRTDCGHLFCQMCLTQHMDKASVSGVLSCPVCRKPYSEGSLGMVISASVPEDGMHVL